MALQLASLSTSLPNLQIWVCSQAYSTLLFDTSLINLCHPLRELARLPFSLLNYLWYISVLMVGEEILNYLLVLLLIKVSCSHFSMMVQAILEKHLLATRKILSTLM